MIESWVCLFFSPSLCDLWPLPLLLSFPSNSSPGCKHSHQPSPVSTEMQVLVLAFRETIYRCFSEIHTLNSVSGPWYQLQAAGYLCQREGAGKSDRRQSRAIFRSSDCKHPAGA